MSMSRYFKLNYGDNKYNQTYRFSCENPHQASHQAFSSIIKSHIIDPDTPCDFSILVLKNNQVF